MIPVSVQLLLHGCVHGHHASGGVLQELQLPTLRGPNLRLLKQQSNSVSLLLHESAVTVAKRAARVAVSYRPRSTPRLAKCPSPRP